MPRRRIVAKREIIPDARFNSVLVSKFINSLLNCGKKTVARKIFYDAMDIVETRITEDDAFTVFVPFVVVIAAMGGNIGIQSCTTVVRGLATGDIDDNITEVVTKQVAIAALVGVVCAAISSVVAFYISRTDPVLVSIVVGASLFTSILIAATVGALAPALCKKFGIDPTAASGPFVTVSIDIIGITIYFTIAILSLRIIG